MARVACGPSGGLIVTLCGDEDVVAVVTVPPVQHQNFEESQEAMKQQLLQLSILLRALDPELCDFLGRWSHISIGGRCWRSGGF